MGPVAVVILLPGVDLGAAVHPAPDSVSAASQPATARHPAPARCRGRQTQAPEVQALPHRVLSLRGPSVRIDIAEVQTAEGKLCLFVGIDRTAKFVAARLVATADRRTAWEFLQPMLEADVLAADNFARRLKTLNGLTPCEYICKIPTSEPDRFILNPIQQMPGLNS